jgi:hypothetical protein
VVAGSSPVALAEYLVEIWTAPDNRQGLFFWVWRTLRSGIRGSQPFECRLRVTESLNISAPSSQRHCFTASLRIAPSLFARKRRFSFPTMAADPSHHSLERVPPQNETFRPWPQLMPPWPEGVPLKNETSRPWPEVVPTMIGSVRPRPQLVRPWPETLAAMAAHFHFAAGTIHFIAGGIPMCGRKGLS